MKTAEVLFQEVTPKNAEFQVAPEFALNTVFICFKICQYLRHKFQVRVVSAK